MFSKPNSTICVFFFFSSRRRHTRCSRDWSSDVCSSDLLSGAERLGVLDDLYPRTPILPPVVVRPFVFALARRAALVPSDEVQRAFWLPLGRLSEPGARREATLTLRGGSRTFPAYLVDEEPICGMTERILIPFVDLVTSFDPRV